MSQAQECWHSCIWRMPRELNIPQPTAGYLTRSNEPSAGMLAFLHLANAAGCQAFDSDEQQ